ncbi:MAG: phospholipase D family protein [Caldilineaceae bacterium]|nr:phospholipase D family protein [Caldilineaceae bacterium]
MGTSFTLDLMALLTAPLAFTFFDAHDEDGAPLADPVALLEALRRHAEKVTLFCQAGAISVPSPDQILLAYLEGSVIEVEPKLGGGIFHPKVWVLNFESTEGPAIYRILCLSRNLTFARAWDTCLRLEGDLKEEGNYSRNEPFADLLLQLPGLAIRETGPELREDLERMADEVRQVDFKTPRPFTDFKVHSLGLSGSHVWPFPTAGRSLAISPFLAGSTVRGLVRQHGLEVLISRPEAFADVVRRIGIEALPRTCYVLSSGAGLDARDAEEEGEEQPDGQPPVEDGIELSGLHAKLFLFENGPETRLFTGSANATGAAYHANVEVLVELVGKTKHCGIDALLGLEEDPKLETLRSLLQEYHPPTCPGPPPCHRELERESDRLVRMLAAVPLKATAQHVDAEELWDITLSGELPEIPEGPKVKVWPATLPSKAALRIDGLGKARHESVEAAEPTDAIVTFKRMSFEALTAFFAFEVSLQEEQCEVRQRFAVTAELVGAPENRSGCCARSFRIATGCSNSCSSY